MLEYKKKDMINNKTDLKHYLKQDALALRIVGRKRPKLFGDYIWKFEILLRKTEYYHNVSKKCKFLKIPYLFKKFRFARYSLKLGFSIPLNVFDEGLSIARYGNIVVNAAAKVGKNCRIHEGVNIGSTNGSDKAPIIGNNVFIGTGAKIIGDISIADDTAIGANAVVVKTISESGSTYGGIPAKKISNNSSRSNLSPYLFDENK